MVSCDAEVLCAIVDELIEGERSQQGDGLDATPQHLRPGFFAEVGLLKDTIRSTFRSYDGVDWPTNLLYNTLIYNIRNRFLIEYRKMGLDNTLDFTVRHALEKPHSPAVQEYTMQPGFYKFTQRLLNRTLQFYHLRRCECKGGLVHMHGGRKFYGGGEWKLSDGAVPAGEDVQET